MNYKLAKALSKDKNIIFKYKLNNTLEYAENISEKELRAIKYELKNDIDKNLNNYWIIVIEGKEKGCVEVTRKNNALSLKELYIEEEHRNKGIGTNIIKEVLRNNKIVYLWVYKDNNKAISLYKKLGFRIIEETKTRYHMKYEENRK